MSSALEPPAEAGSVSLRDLSFFFLRLGATAFGGPVGHIAMMEEQLVRRRRWLSREKFLDLLAASNLIPGPSSSELAIHIGYLLGGWRGLLLAGICFILPAACMVAALAWAYMHFGKLQAFEGILYGIKPVVIAVILQALWNLTRTAIKTKFLAMLGLLSVALAFFSLQPILVLLVVGAFAVFPVLANRFGNRSEFGTLASLFVGRFSIPWRGALRTAVSTGLAATTSFSLGGLFLVFLSIGAVVFGSGYVLLAFLRADLVTGRGWLTDAQLLDAIAIGQVTPGPVFTTATFIGFLLHGLSGAAVATVAIFLPAFVLVAASGPLIPRLRQSPLATTFLDGIVAASLGLMAVVGWQLGRSSIVDFTTAALALFSLLFLFAARLNSVWLVALGAIIGFAAHHAFH